MSGKIVIRNQESILANQGSIESTQTNHDQIVATQQTILGKP